MKSIIGELIRGSGRVRLKRHLAERGIDIEKCMGGGYDDYIAFKGRYRVCKGSRASKKSKTTALDFIIKLVENPEANLLVMRKTYGTLKDSCFAELKWAVGRLELENYFEYRQSPLEITYSQ